MSDISLPNETIKTMTLERLFQLCGSFYEKGERYDGSRCLHEISTRCKDYGMFRILRDMSEIVP
jgi:hypothetical protein